MEILMLRKWELISYALYECKRLPAIRDLIGIANRIDSLLVDLDYDDYTESWIRDYEEVHQDIITASTATELLYIIESLANDTSYCSACKKHSEFCDKCCFGNQGGKKAFQSFLYQLERAIREATEIYQ
jgi:hypothetical protein